MKMMKEIRGVGGEHISVSRGLILSVVVCLWLTPIGSGATVASSWSDYEVVANSTQFSLFSRTAAAVDSSGYLHVLYAEEAVVDFEELYHQWYDGSEWHVETIDDATYGQRSFSLGIDSTDTVHICYIDGQEHVKYAWGTPGSWSYATIDLESNSCTNPMLVIDGNDKVHICYNVGDYTVRYSTNASGTWLSSTAVYDSSGYLKAYRLLCGAENKPVICYQVLNQHKYAVSNAGLWILNDAVTSRGYTGDAAIDSNDNMHLCFYNSDANLVYATNTGGPWSSEVMDAGLPSGYWVPSETPAIIVDGTDTIHIFYRNQDDGDNGPLRRAYGQSGSWTYETLAPIYANMVASPVRALAGQCELVAYNRMLREIDHFSQEGADWTKDVIAKSIATCRPTTINVHPDGQIDIFHFDYLTDYLLATTFEPVTKESVTLPAFSEGSIPGSRVCDATIDSNAARHVLLTGQNYGSLSHWTDGGGLWQSSCVDVDPNRSCGYSLALSPAGTAYAAYYGVVRETESWPFLPGFPPMTWEWNEAHDFHISSLLGPSWLCQTTAWTEVEAGQVRSDICVDASGKVHCVYIGGEYISYSNYNSNLSYLSNVTGSWQNDIIDPNVSGASDQGSGFISMSVDSGGNPHVVYMWDDELKYACKQGGVWTYETLTSNAVKNVKRCMVEVDSSDSIYICYYDAVTQAVMLARGSLGAWSHEAVVDSCGNKGGYPSMALDSLGKVHISYYQEDTDNTIHYVTNAFPKPGITVNREYMYWFVEKNSTAQTTVTVTSSGLGPLAILDVGVTGANASKFSISHNYTTPLNPGQECVITVEFDTSSEGIYEAMLNIESNDPAIPILSIPMTVRCYVPPTSSLFCKITSYDFGSVVEDTASDDLVVRVQNNGTTSLNLAGIMVDDDINYVCENLKFPVSLDPGESYITWVRFTPQSTGRFDAMLYLSASTPPLMPPVFTTIQLTGLGVLAPRPDISVEPFGHDFGRIQYTASSVPTVFSIYNYGDADLVVSELSVSDTVNYTVDPNMGKWPIGPDLPATVLPKQAVMFGLRFHPSAIGQFDTTVRIFSNDPDEYKLYMPVTGQGYHWNACDFNVDGFVNGLDFGILADQWLNEPGTPSADVAPVQKLDEQIDIQDLAVFAQEWLETFVD